MTHVSPVFGQSEPSVESIRPSLCKILRFAEGRWVCRGPAAQNTFVFLDKLKLFDLTTILLKWLPTCIFIRTSAKREEAVHFFIPA